MKKHAAREKGSDGTTHHKQALVISREIGDRRGEGADLGNLGLVYADLGEVQKAIGYYEQALVIAREIQDPHIADIAEAQLKRLRSEPSSQGG